jgi:geranylgeranyl pyrophosphate synthase
MKADDFDRWVRHELDAVEAALEAWVPADAPAGLGGAMRYGVLDGGKRLRALLVRAACEAVQGPAAAALRAAVAVELIHAYSLIHDDMPCMDNDVLRRGKPTVHVRYGQAQAMLAGDAMQALAFEVLTAPPARARAWASTSRLRCRPGCARCWRARPGMPAWPAGRRSTWPASAGRWTKAPCATCTGARPAPCCRPAC